MHIWCSDHGVHAIAHFLCDPAEDCLKYAQPPTLRGLPACWRRPVPGLLHCRTSARGLNLGVRRWVYVGPVPLSNMSSAGEPTPVYSGIPGDKAVVKHFIARTNVKRRLGIALYNLSWTLA